MFWSYTVRIYDVYGVYGTLYVAAFILVYVLLKLVRDKRSILSVRPSDRMPVRLSICLSVCLSVFFLFSHVSYIHDVMGNQRELTRVWYVYIDK